MRLSIRLASIATLQSVGLEMACNSCLAVLGSSLAFRQTMEICRSSMDVATMPHLHNIHQASTFVCLLEYVIGQDVACGDHAVLSMKL